MTADPGLRSLIEAAMRLHCEAYAVEREAALLGQTLSELGRGQRELRLTNEALRLRSDRERQRRRAEERENADLRGLATAIAHDLRHPLVAALMALDAVEGASDPSERARATHLVRRGLEDSLDHIEGLLYLAGLGAGGARREPVDVSELVRTIAERIAEQYPQVVLELDVPDGLVTDGDPCLLKLLFEALLVNAVEHGSVGDLAQISLRREPHESGVLIWRLSDRGPGVPESQKARLLRPFARVSADPGHRGMGLATAERAVAAHGGRIWVENGGEEPGASFCFTLPDDGRNHPI